MKKIMKLALVALVLFSTNNILSQNNVETDTIVPLNLEEVIVSTPFKETVKNNVLKINRLSLKDLNITKSQNLANSLLEIPGIDIISTGPGISKPVIRGLSSNRVTVFNQYMRQENQQWGDEHGIDVAAFGVESVEVIKGPLSVLYGSDALGGVIYLNPDSYIQDGLEVEVGSFYNTNYKGLTTNIGVKGNLNKISYLVQGSMVDNKDFETPDKKIESTYFENTDFKAGLGFESKSFISDLRFNISKTKVGIPHDEEEHDDHDDEDHGDEDHDDEDHEDEEHEEEESYQDLENSVISWKNRILFNNKSEIELTFGYSNNKRKEFGHHDEEEHDDHGDEDHDDEDHDDEDHDEHEGEAHIDMDLKTTTVDMKYLFPKTENSEFVLGTNIMSQENTNIGEEELIPDAKKKDFGFYGVSHVHGTNLDYIIGVRADFRKIEKFNYNKRFSSFTTSLGLKKDFDNEGVVRLNISTGHRAPNLSELFSDGIHHGTNRYEIGSKDLMEERNFQTDLSILTYSSSSSFGMDLFYNSIKDYIYLNPAGTKISGMPVYNYTQSNAVLFGGEIFYDKKTSIDWLSHKTSLAMIRGEKDDSEVLPFIPPFTIKHSFDLNFGKNSFEINGLLKGKKGNVALFETETDSYFVMNLTGSHKVQLSDNEIDISWSINNLLDKEYFDHMSRLKNLGIHEMGRNISIGINYIF